MGLIIIITNDSLVFLALLTKFNTNKLNTEPNNEVINTIIGLINLFICL